MSQLGQRLLNSLSRRCNNLLLPDSPLTSCHALLVDGSRVGLVKPDIARVLTGRCPDVFRYSPDCGGGPSPSVRAVSLVEGLHGYERVSAAMADAFGRLRAEAAFDCLTRGWRDELFGVRLRSTGGRPLFQVERSAASLLGVAQWGCHVNGYTQGPDGRPAAMWLARRAPSKPTWPGCLDNLVAGGLSSGARPLANARKEAAEEAGIPPRLLDRLRPVGTVSYFYEDSRGVFPDVEYCYDLRLPEDFVPANADGEVSEFCLVPLASLAELIVRDDFKPNSGLVCLDFLLRRGVIEADAEPLYDLLVEMCHTRLPLD